MAVGSDAQFQTLLVAAMREYSHCLLVMSWVQHHIDREALAREVQCGCGQGCTATIERETGAGADVAATRSAQDLEVVNLAEIVASDVLAETDADVVADAQYAIDWSWCTERHRTPRVFHTREDRRGCCEVATCMAAIHHSTKVIVLLDRVGLAEEARLNGSVGRYAVHHTRCLFHQIFVVEERAHVHPVLVALCGKLVLQLDMVEASVVHVEAFDTYRKVVFLLLVIVWTLGVHHPFVARSGHFHRSSRRYEVGGERKRRVAFDVFLIIKADDDVLVVEFGCWINLNDLCDHLARWQIDGVAGSCESYAIDHHLGSLCIVGVAQAEREVFTRQSRQVGVVAHVNREACRLVERNIADRRLVGPDAELVDFHCLCVQHSSRVVVFRDALVLVRLVGGTAACAEH